MNTYFSDYNSNAISLNCETQRIRYTPPQLTYYDNKYRLFPQREHSDCVVACLENFLQKPREDFAHLIRWSDHQAIPTRIMSWDNFHWILNHFKTKTKYLKKNVRAKEKVLIAVLQGNAKGASHAVFSFKGKIFEPFTAKVWKEKDFLKAHKARILGTIIKK